MSAIKSIFRAIWARVHIVLAGIAAVARLILLAVESLIGLEGTIRSRLIARLTAPEGQRLAFDFARAFVPNLAIGSKFITAYDNSGTVLVTRFDDVKDVLRRTG